MITVEFTCPAQPTITLGTPVVFQDPEIYHLGAPMVTLSTTTWTEANQGFCQYDLVGMTYNPVSGNHHDATAIAYYPETNTVTLYTDNQTYLGNTYIVQLQIWLDGVLITVVDSFNLEVTAQIGDCSATYWKYYAASTQIGSITEVWGSAGTAIIADEPEDQQGFLNNDGYYCGSRTI